MTNLDIDALFEQGGAGRRARPQRRTDTWVDGRTDTWHGHYRENPASRAGADARRMAEDKPYATEVAEALRSDDAEILAGNDALANAGLTIEPVSPGIGVVIRGVDMANPTDPQVGQIRRLLMERKVVFLRDQGHMERVTLVEPSEEDEVPFWADANGERHYSVLLTSRESIDTPLGYS